jgi:hypothetical protein
MIDLYEVSFNLIMGIAVLLPTIQLVRYFKSKKENI